MASADIEKLAVFDSRIVQTRPKFAVDKGALSITNAPFQALSQTSSQHTYSVQVPSETTFVDRAVNWTSQVGVAISFAVSTTIASATSTTWTFGNATTSEKSPWGWCAFPLQSLTSTIQATINDTNVVINTGDVLKEVLRLVDIRANTLQRTTPTKLDTYALVPVDSGYVNSTYGSYINNAVIQEEAPNSAFWLSGGNNDLSQQVPYTDNQGNYITSTSSPISLVSGTSFNVVSTTGSFTATPTVVVNADGSIVLTGTPSATGAFAFTLTVYTAPTFTEKLVLSPFVFSDIHERDTGLFGIQNIQFVMNMRNPQDCRLVRQRETSAVMGSGNTGNAAYSLTSAYQSLSSSSGPFARSRLDVLFLTPSLDLPLPPKSVVPYMEFPRYITNTGAIAPNALATLSTQTITLPQIPDYIVIYVKATPQALTAAGNPSQYGDWYFPITNVSLQWDNYAGLMSTMSQQQLYEIAIENGISQDYQQWSGRLPAGWSAGEQGSTASQWAQSVGGFLVIKPGKDYSLSTGQAPSLVGNYTFQANLTVANYTNVNWSAANIYVMTINSGFFESVKGTSRVVKGILSEADIISAPMSSIATRSALSRAVGGKGLLSKLGHSISKVASHIMPLAKMALPHLKPHLPTEIQQGLSHFGLGDGHYASHSGGEGDGRKKKSALHRLR